MIKVLFICHGNICRSTMAQSVFTRLARQSHLDSYFAIDSAATSTEEIESATPWDKAKITTGADSVNPASGETDDTRGLYIL